MDAGELYLHKVVFPISGPVLVTLLRHELLGKQVIVSMLLLPLFLLPLLCLSSLFLFLQMDMGELAQDLVVFGGEKNLE